MDRLMLLAACAAGAIVGAIGTKAVLAAAGFTTGGIPAVTVASCVMSAAAAAYRGGVAAGGVVAAIQAAGASGIRLATHAILGTLVATVGAVTSHVIAASLYSNYTV